MFKYTPDRSAVIADTSDGEVEIPLTILEAIKDFSEVDLRLVLWWQTQVPPDCLTFNMTAEELTEFTCEPDDFILIWEDWAETDWYRSDITAPAVKLDDGTICIPGFFDYVSPDRRVTVVRKENR